MRHPSAETKEFSSTDGPGNPAAAASWVVDRRAQKVKSMSVETNPNLNVIEYSPRLDFILERINVAEGAHAAS